MSSISNPARIVIREWIAISAQLPKYDEKVIVQVSTGSVTTARLIRTDARGHHWKFDEDNEIYWNSQRVEYWMSLPEPYLVKNAKQ